MGWGDTLGGAASGAGIGFGFGGPVGGAIGGVIGGTLGWLGGREAEEEAEEREAEMRRLMAPEAHQPFGKTQAGQDLYAMLTAQVNQQYLQGRREGLTRSTQTTQGRGMLSSTVLPYAQAQAMAPVEQARMMGTAKAGATMAGIEANLYAQHQQRELQKKMAAAGYLQRAGEAGQANWGQFMGGAVDLASQFAMQRMGQDWQQGQDKQWQDWWTKQQGGG